MVLIFIYSLLQPFAVIGAYSVQQFVGSTYMQVFVKFIILGPFLRVSLYERSAYMQAYTVLLKIVCCKLMMKYVEKRKGRKTMGMHGGGMKR